MSSNMPLATPAHDTAEVRKVGEQPPEVPHKGALPDQEQ